MTFNSTLLDFNGRESELRLYSRPVTNNVFRCDDYGVIKERVSDSAGELCYDYPFEDGSDVCRVMDYDDWLNNEDYKRERSIQSSLSRTKTMVYQLARGQEWQWFCTFTFDLKRVDRYDFKAVGLRMTQWLSRVSKRHGLLEKEFKYIIVPEQHKDGAWHFHGLFICDDDLMHFYRVGKHLDYRVRSWPYGFSTSEPVKDSLAVSNYITKYLTKDMVSVTKGKKRYWHSRNLSLPKRYNISFAVYDGLGAPSADVLVGMLGDMVTHISQSDTCNGKVTYLQLKSGSEEVLSSLWGVWKHMEDIEVVVDE